MLNSVNFINYRCFQEHKLPLDVETIIVGRNNAGKSTVVEGLRLVSIITQRYKNVAFKKVPDWLDLPASNKGVGVSLAGLNISWENIFHRYQDPPGKIEAIFGNAYKLTVHIGAEKNIHAVIKKENNQVITTKGQAKAAKLPLISVLPQIAPLQKEENILSTEYVKANISSHLSSAHFRNQLLIYYDDYFEEFKEIAEDSWPGLQIISLEAEKRLPGNPVELLVRDGNFVAEVGWMGHGLQMWLQTMWFVTRSKDSDTIILDEPDVYMHPDLQRRLLRFLRGRNQQCLIATHSTEILAETEPHNILIIERSRRKSSFSTSLPAAQKVLEGIGSAQNLHLTRLWSAGRLLLVEGKDVKILKHFQNLVFPNSIFPFDSLPNMPIGGWSGWPYAVGSAMLLTNAFDQQIKTYCILDSDYHPPEMIKERYTEAAKKNVHLHIWGRKEIENYLIKPAVINRIIAKTGKGNTPTESEIESKLEELTNYLKNYTIDRFSQEFFFSDRSKGVTSANEKARNLVESSWKTLDERLYVVSGKDLISQLSTWAQNNYGASFGIYTLVYEIQLYELDREVIELIEGIENLKN